MLVYTLHWADYVVFVGFLAISLGIGIYHSLTGGRQRTTQEFFSANRQLSVIPTALSVLVSFLSAILTLGSTAEFFLYGSMYMIWIGPCYSLAIVLTERLVVPWIYPHKFVSINDYLERRYESKAVRILGSIIAILGAVLYMGSVMYAPSAALETATGLPTTVSIPVMAVVSIAYTALGGIKAVIWTDVFQFATMIIGTLIIFIRGSVFVGGFSRAVEISSSEGRFDLVNWWSPDPTVRHTVFGFMFGYTVYWFYFFALSQVGVQRYSSIPTMKKARIMLLLNIPPAVLIFFFSSAIGVVVFAFYSSIQCDPIENKDVSSPNQVLALFVNTVFSDWPGFVGLFLATLYGGALSTVSSSLSGAAANCWDDILKCKLSSLKEHRQALLNRFLVVIFGVFGSAVAFIAALVPGTIIQVNALFLATVYGPMVGIFLLGGLTKYGNYKGALIGGLTALAISAWLAVGSFQLDVRPPTLPPTSTDGCVPSSFVNSTIDDVTFSTVTSLRTDLYINSSVTVLPNETSSQAVIIRDTRPLATELTGVNRFYALSYLWYTLFGTINALVLGLIASLLFRDRQAESRIDSKLFIPLRLFFSCESTDEPDYGSTSLASTDNNDTFKRETHF